MASLFIMFQIFTSCQPGKVFRGVYTGDLFQVIQHVLWWIQGLLEKKRWRGRDGEGVNPLVFLCSSLFSTFCLPHSFSLSLYLPPSFIFGNISFSWVRPVMLTKSQPSELSPPPPLCPCLRSLLYQTEEGQAGGNRNHLQSSFLDKDGEGIIHTLWVCISSFHVQLFTGYGYVCGWKQSWESEKQQSLTWDCEF